MKLAELTDYLESQGIRRDAYLINGAGTGEEYGIEHGPRGWSVFYHERGSRTSEVIFQAEEDAVSELAQRIKRDRNSFMKK
jgi:hypothetical protein